MAVSTVTSKGQVTIPKKIRERLGLKVGDRLVFRLDSEGRLVVELEAAERFGTVPGLLHHLAADQPVTVKDMDEAIRRHLDNKHTGSTPR